jgi:hypothetical protein
MATIFLLGPSFLQSGPKALLKVRRELAAIFDLAGHRAFLMEDEADKKGHWVGARNLVEICVNRYSVTTGSKEGGIGVSLSAVGLK